MEYFNLLEFKKEPFSNSPEPEFLFASTQHNTCLQRLELAVRLRRGLNIVIGAVGTGKTTLCRKLLQNLSVPAVGDAPEIETFLLLDPAVDSRLSFVKTVAVIVGISDIATDDTEWQIKEKIKNYLFEKGVQEQKNIVLIIDEGQKIPDDCLEILREFLNYETNSFKLLQIIIFAQPEFKKNLTARANLLDRVNYLYNLPPLSLRQTKAMIEYRISTASQDPVRKTLFTWRGIFAVYIATAGYPRKIVSLCHQVLLMMIIRGKRRAGWFLVRSCVTNMIGAVLKRVVWATLGLLIFAFVLGSALLYWNDPMRGGDRLKSRLLSGIDIKKDPDVASMPIVPEVKPSPEDRRVFVSVNNDHSQKETLPVKLPESLGTVEIKHRMTVWRILESVYGDTGSEIKEKFILANPGIKNIDEIIPGMRVTIPVLSGKVRPVSSETILVALDYRKDMTDAYDSFIQKKDIAFMPAIRFLSVWNQREGRQFAVILDQRFSTQEEARDTIRRLPSDLGVTARVLSQWDPDTVAFNSRFIQ